MIQDGQLRMGALLEKIRVRAFLEEEVRALDPLGLSLEDVDTPEDYERLKTTLGIMGTTPTS